MSCQLLGKELLFLLFAINVSSQAGSGCGKLPNSPASQTVPDSPASGFTISHFWMLDYLPDFSHLLFPHPYLPCEKQLHTIMQRIQKTLVCKMLNLCCVPNMWQPSPRVSLLPFPAAIYYCCVGDRCVNKKHVAGSESLSK